jgi:hypothetical protein
MITQEQQNGMDHAITNWLAEQMNSCESNEEQRHFMGRLLAASIHAYFYPYLDLPTEKKAERIAKVAEIVGDVVGKAAAKFLRHKGE